MNKYIKSAMIVLLATSVWTACKKDTPVDEDGLLITARKECFISSLELLGSDYVSVRVGAAVIDTTAQTVNVKVQFGVDLKHIFPQFRLAQDCKLTPKVTGFVDFSDTLHPKQWTVISGNRQIKKTYTVTISQQSR
jgi:hypothetical protein